MDTEALGERIYQARVAQHLTLKKVEELSGLTNSLVSNIEKGKRPRVAFKTICRLANVLGMSLGDLDGLDTRDEDENDLKKAKEGNRNGRGDG